MEYTKYCKLPSFHPKINYNLYSCMAEALVSAIIEQLVLVLRQQTEEGIRLVVGVDEEVRKLTSNFQAIQAVLEDAESRQVMDKAVRDWLDKLKHTSYDIDDVFDEWITMIKKEAENASKPMKKVCSLIRSHCIQISKYPEIALKIKSLNTTLDVITMEKDKFNFRLMEGTRKLERPMTTSLIDISEVHGRDYEKNRVINMLLSESSERPTLPVISIVGMGGIGKTTLAGLVFNDENVEAYFNIKIWVCVSEPFDNIRIAKAILESLRRVTPNLVELETLLREIHQSINGKRFLLVLDDVWTEDPQNWVQLRSALKCGARGSKILVTTRKENTAKIMGTTTTNIISLGQLPNEECWSLFSQIALSGRVSEDCSRLEDIGRKIVGKCSGLPLAVKVLGSLLSLKTNWEQWQSVLDSELWKVEEIEKGIFPPLLFSYYDLPSKLRKCFSYCAIFPKDYKIDKDQLIRLWMAQGYLKTEGREDIELVGEEYFENLAMRSFFQEFERSECDRGIISCKMHDIVHDFAQYLTKNECFKIEVASCTKSHQLQYSNRRARHSMVICDGHSSFPNSICDETKLRSLVVINKAGFATDITICKLFDNLTCLRTFEMLGFDPTTRLPRAIKKLKHLRYLKLSKTQGLYEFPEEVCDLYNLQILDVSGCSHLLKLPGGIGRLVNLRHLINDGTDLRYMPKGLERLTCLRTLSVFAVSDAKYACRLASLKSLKHLQGHLTLARLGNVTNVCHAKNTQLGSRKKIVCLKLEFGVSAYRSEGLTNKDDELVEVLQPSPDLEKLIIHYYLGDILFPSWLMSLTKLRMLTLSLCKKCEQLPFLGRLPSLESLHLDWLPSVKELGNEFLGIASDDRSLSFPVIAFPKLKYLKFHNMWEWEDWDIYEIMGEKEIQIMPRLCELELTDCNKLKALPDYILRLSTLNRLEIKLSPNLRNRYMRGIGADWPKIAHIPNIQIGNETLQGTSRFSSNNLQSFIAI